MSFLSISTSRLLCDATLVLCMAAVTGAAVAQAQAPGAPAARPPAVQNKVETFGIHGSNTIGSQLMPAIVEAYAAALGARVRVSSGRDPEEITMSVTRDGGPDIASIELHSHGSGTAAPSLVGGRALIGMMSRPITDAEHKAVLDAGKGDMRTLSREHILGLDALLVLVAPNNSVKSLSVGQLADIFSGAVTDWSQVGGAPGPINIYARDAKSGTYDTFNALVLAPAKLKLAATAKRFESSPDLSDAVARDPNGIGFTGFAYLRNARALAVTNECGMAFEPELFQAKTEEYPLSRRLFLYSTPLPAGSFAEGLVAFALSPKADQAVRDSGFIDHAVALLPPSRQIQRLPPAPKSSADPARPASALRASSRLSITFRFANTSADLDNKSTKDLERLADFIRFSEAQPLPAQGRRPRVALVGFSDATGSTDVNVALSLDRARAVQRAVAAQLKNERLAAALQITGFGPAIPVACNGTDAGRQRNRRVEVWLQ